MSIILAVKVCFFLPKKTHSCQKKNIDRGLHKKSCFSGEFCGDEVFLSKKIDYQQVNTFK
jgi:hypothetical protein